MSRRSPRPLSSEQIARLREIISEGHAPTMLARVACLPTHTLCRAAAGAALMHGIYGAASSGVDRLIAWHRELSAPREPSGASVTRGRPAPRLLLIAGGRADEPTP